MHQYRGYRYWSRRLSSTALLFETAAIDLTCWSDHLCEGVQEMSPTIFVHNFEHFVSPLFISLCLGGYHDICKFRLDLWCHTFRWVAFAREVSLCNTSSSLSGRAGFTFGLFIEYLTWCYSCLFGIFCLMLFLCCCGRIWYGWDVHVNLSSLIIVDRLFARVMCCILRVSFINSNYFSILWLKAEEK